jgi:hypothetical protein
MKYNEDLPVSDYLREISSWLTLRQWSNRWVHVPLALACIFSVVFILVELFVAPEPIMAPFLLKQKVPVLVGANNFLVALCNFSVMYFFPMWFQTVALTSASTAGMLMLIYFNITLTAVWIMDRLTSDAEQCMHVHWVFVCRVS